MAHQELLSKIPIFESLTPEELKKLSEHAEHRKLQQGEVVFKEGDSDSTSLYIIEEGDIEISHGEGKAHVTFNTFHAGQYFGELALLMVIRDLLQRQQSVQQFLCVLNAKTLLSL